MRKAQVIEVMVAAKEAIAAVMAVKEAAAAVAAAAAAKEAPRTRRPFDVHCRY